MPKSRQKRRGKTKQKAVLEILRDPYESLWSTESIRKRLGVHESVVRTMRDELYPERKSWPRYFLSRSGAVARMQIAGIQSARQDLARAVAAASPQALAQAREEHANALEHYDHVRTMLREARRLYASMTGRQLRLDAAGDPTDVPELEEVARVMAGRYPELLGAHGYEEDGDSTEAAARLYERLVTPARRPRLAEAIERASWQAA